MLLGSWPLWVLAALIVSAALGLGWLLWRRRSRQPGSLRLGRAAVLWLLETALAALLLVLLWQPAMSVSTLKPQQNVVAVVVDDSTSMAVADANGTREDAAIALLRGGLLDSLKKRFVVRLYRAGAEATRIDKLDQLTARQPATHLGESLKTVAADSATLPIGAVIFLSDGADNTGGIDRGTLAQLREHRLPVNTVGFGREQMDKDIELANADVPVRTLANSRMEALVTVRQNGFSGNHARITVRDAGKTLAARDVTLRDAPSQTETILLDAGHEGVRDLRITVDPLKGEESSANNQVTRVLYVDPGPRRVLYVEGEPRWEYKFIRRAVEDDKQLQLVSMLRTTQNKIYRQGVSSPEELQDGFPTKPEDLFAYQGLILGSVEAAYFSAAQQEMIRQFVDRRGGGLLFLGGRASLADGGYKQQPFDDLLPVILPSSKNTFVRDMVEADLTASGKDSLICRVEEDPDANADRWSRFPLLANYQDAGQVKPGAIELAQMDVPGNGKLPLLVTQNYGRGRSAVFATGGSWRWKMQQPVGDTSHQTVWRQMIRWLSADTPAQVVASVSQRLLEDDGHLQLRADVRDANYVPACNVDVEARIVGPDGSTDTVPLKADNQHSGMYLADWDAPKRGSYIAEINATRPNQNLGRDVITFQREDGVAENFGRAQNRELLEKLAQETGGNYYKPSNARRLGEDISYSEAGISMRETKDLWNMPAVFLAILLLRAAEWLLRRKWGFV